MKNIKKLVACIGSMCLLVTSIGGIVSNASIIDTVTSTEEYKQLNDGYTKAFAYNDGMYDYDVFINDAVLNLTYDEYSKYDLKLQPAGYKLSKYGSEYIKVSTDNPEIAYAIMNYPNNTRFETYCYNALPDGTASETDTGYYIITYIPYEYESTLKQMLNEGTLLSMSVCVDYRKYDSLITPNEKEFDNTVLMVAEDASMVKSVEELPMVTSVSVDDASKNTYKVHVKEDFTLKEYFQLEEYLFNHKLVEDDHCIRTESMPFIYEEYVGSDSIDTVSVSYIKDTTLGDSTTVGESEPTGVRGDINYDGKVTTVDLLLLKKYLLGIVKW